MQSSNSNSPCSINYFVIVLLPTIFLLGIVFGYLNIIQLKVETHSVVIISIIYFIYLLFIQHNANYVICNMRKNSADLEKELQNSIKENSLTIGDKTKSTINIERYISEYYKTFRNDNFASVAPSFFPMLGILGTFTAIAISMPDFSTKDTDALDSQISLLLSGIGTAFYASIFGIFLSIVWNYFEKRGLSKADADSHYLQNLYREYIWTDSELKKHEHTQHDIRDEKMIDALKSAFNLDFIQKLNENHLDNFQMIINETNKNFTNVATHMKLVSTDLKDTISRIHNSQKALDANAKIERNISKFVDVTSKLETSLSNFDSSLEKSLNTTFYRIDDELGDIIIKLGDFAATISEQNRLLNDTILKHNGRSE